MVKEIENKKVDIKEKISPTYYSILTAEVRYSDKLSPMEKIIFSEITALSNAKGMCWASNQYFANLYNVEPTTVSEWINNLKRNSFIKINGASSKKRVITVLNTLRKKPNVDTQPKEKAEGQPSEKAEHNNTSINNIDTIVSIQESSFNSEKYFRGLVNSSNRVSSIVSVYALKKNKHKEFKTIKECNSFLFGFKQALNGIR